MSIFGKYFISITFLLLFYPSAMFSDNSFKLQPPDNIISIDAYPGITIPLSGDDELYKNGLLSKLLADYRFNQYPVFSLLIGGEYDLIPIKALISMSTYTGFGGFGLNFDLSDRLLLKFDSMIGYSHSTINSGISEGEGSGGFYYSGGADLSYRLTQEWRAGLGTSYINNASLYRGLRITAKGSYYINLNSTHAMPVRESSFIEVFPALINYHNTVPVGTALVENIEIFDVKEVEYELNIKNYMDDKIISDGPVLMKEKENSVLAFLPRFNENIKTAAGGKTFITAPLKAVVRYRYNDWLYREKIKHDLVIYSMNSVRWDDPLKTSVFITPEDPALKALTENTLDAVENATRIPVPDKVLIALALYKTIEIQGIKYTPDEETPYQVHIKAPYPVDMIKFPRETAVNKSGTSVDLSLLYCSMLEAAGINTAVVTTPENCFPAFSLENDEMITHSSEMIKYKGKIWVPVELKKTGQSFYKAVTDAAGKWKLYPEDQKKIYTLSEGREKYLTPSPPSKKGNIRLPDKNEITEIYLEDIKNYAYWEIEPEEKMLKSIIGVSEDYPEITNKLGILYARFEKYEEAYREFEKASEKGYAPAMVNLANLYFLDDKLEQALPLYEKAYRKNAYNAPMLQNMAIAYYKRLDFGLTRDIYRKLEFIDYELAEEVPYMAERSSEMKKASKEGHELGLTKIDIFTDIFFIEKGNQYYILNRHKQALAFYEKAYKISPENPQVLLSLARINYELDNYYKATEYYKRLKEISPEKAQQNSYLISQNTGSIQNKALENLKGEVRWAEE